MRSLSTRRIGAFVALAFMLLAHAAAATPVTLVDRRTAGFVGQAQEGPLEQPTLVSSYGEFVATFGASTAGLANPYLAPSVAAYFVNGGQQLYIVRTLGADDASLIGVDGGLPGARTGLQALRDIDSLAIVAIPGATSNAVQAAMIAECESLPDRLAILDPVSATNADAVITQRSNLSSSDGAAALYFPWVQASPAGVSLLLPPSGFAAGAIANTLPHVSPTGSVVSATGVSVTVTSTQQSELDPLGIDTIRFFSGQGVKFWGARTLSDDPDWKYLAVRRAGSTIAASVQAGTAWALFQPNNATLWAQLRTDVSAFMQQLFIAGWFQGTTPTQAYFVKCDATTMTAQDIANGRTIIQIGFAPISPAEFVILQIVQDRSAMAGVPLPSSSLALSAPHPNPFGARTTLAFTLPSAARVTLRVNDVSGRLVRRLCVGETLAAGAHGYAWDGRDDAGAQLAPGVYLVRMQVGERVLTRRVALVR